MEAINSSKTQREVLSIFAASNFYQKHNIPTIIVAGKDYGTGSSRDWAAKGVASLGVHAIIASSFERIHRSNLVGMGVLPIILERPYPFTGLEIIAITADLDSNTAYVQINDEKFIGKIQIFTEREKVYYKHGGILSYIRQR